MSEITETVVGVLSELMAAVRFYKANHIQLGLANGAKVVLPRAKFDKLVSSVKRDYPDRIFITADSDGLTFSWQANLRNDHNKLQVYVQFSKVKQKDLVLDNELFAQYLNEVNNPQPKRTPEHRFSGYNSTEWVINHMGRSEWVNCYRFWVDSVVEQLQKVKGNKNDKVQITISSRDGVSESIVVMKQPFQAILSMIEKECDKELVLMYFSDYREGERCLNISHRNKTSWFLHEKGQHVRAAPYPVLILEMIHNG